MMTLAHPYTLLLLLPLAFAAWRLLRRTSGANLKFSAVARLPVRQSGWRRLLAAAAPWMMLAALAVLVWLPRFRAYPPASAVITLLALGVIVRHRGSLARLLRGTEARFAFTAAQKAREEARRAKQEGGR